MCQTDFSALEYEQTDRQVTWRGVGLEEGTDLDAFVAGEVASRLQDTEGTNAFEVHLRGLATTGFARTSLDQVLAAELPEERDWAAAEALAESYLAREHDVTWPWNMERDKRTPRASLPGADLVGFMVTDGEARLVVGEVKSSSQDATPPNVMTGRSGMGHQIDNLATDLSLICQLLKWLLPRCKGTQHEATFNASVRLFLESGNRAIALAGVLIRDTAPNELDLQARGRAIAQSIRPPTTCLLIALYLPYAIAELPSRVGGQGT